MPKPVPNTQAGSLTDHQRATNDTLNGVTSSYGDAFDKANTKIGFDANDSVTLVGFADPSVLRASDFILV
jgi:hypothetical protein